MDNKVVCKKDIVHMAITAVIEIIVNGDYDRLFFKKIRLVRFVRKVEDIVDNIFIDLELDSYEDISKEMIYIISPIVSTKIALYLKRGK